MRRSEHDDADRARLTADFEAMLAARGDNPRWVEADLRFHRSIYIATHNEFFWPIGQLFSFGLRQMFEIAARGSHRPRAVSEHEDILKAISSASPIWRGRPSMTLLGNAASDIDRILHTNTP